MPAPGRVPPTFGRQTRFEILAPRREFQRLLSCLTGQDPRKRRPQTEAKPLTGTLPLTDDCEAIERIRSINRFAIAYWWMRSLDALP